MLKLIRKRQAAGNICLVLFTAFLLTLMSPVFLAGNAEAANGVTLFESQNQIDSDNKIVSESRTGTFTLDFYLALATPLTDPDFGNMFIDLLGSKVYLKDMSTKVYSGVYDNVYGAVYHFVYDYTYTGTLPVDITAKIYKGDYDNLLETIIVTLKYKPKGSSGSGSSSSGTGDKVSYIGNAKVTEKTNGEIVIEGAFGTIVIRDIGSHWAKEDIILMASKQVVKGFPDGTFKPEATVTRAQFAAFLQRALGLAEVKPTKAAFKDVKPTAWYYGVVEAAFAAGLIKGYGDGNFKPEGLITREEMAMMVTNALKASGKNSTLTSSQIDAVLAKFTDDQGISSWAKEAAAIAVSEGIIKGRTETSYVPGANATRAEGTVMIKRVLTNLNKL